MIFIQETPCDVICRRMSHNPAGMACWWLTWTIGTGSVLQLPCRSETTWGSRVTAAGHVPNIVGWTSLLATPTNRRLGSRHRRSTSYWTGRGQVAGLEHLHRFQLIPLARCCSWSSIPLPSVLQGRRALDNSTLPVTVESKRRGMQESPRHIVPERSIDLAPQRLCLGCTGVTIL